MPLVFASRVAAGCAVPASRKSASLAVAVGSAETVVAVFDNLVEKAIISYEKASISHATVQRLYATNSRMYFVFGSGMGLIGLVLAAVAGWNFMESQVVGGMRAALPSRRMGFDGGCRILASC